ncbi:GntR family transcriptional regulator [Erysipelothrix sp. HDW6C]|uniref:GntR family transcriptional regulator n=1 Tax=Erysipelothrix sp. HDW6C TaxID=2714930 RepID=UPI00140776E2|nr:GntR family transcriptional regulator [Erysipelothrix sp. HDW6C]QIK69378.1 GntR family transcriptional regulator [Erysipelothrix sp. HDW6C]
MSLGKSSIAIYRQIIDYFRYEIASGRVKPGDRIDSIRNLALEFKVNPNTVQKALNELEREGLVATDRTNGKFVTDDMERIAALRGDLCHEISVDFVNKVKDLNMEVTEIMVHIQSVWEEKK